MKCWLDPTACGARQRPLGLRTATSMRLEPVSGAARRRLCVQATTTAPPAESSTSGDVIAASAIETLCTGRQRPRASRTATRTPSRMNATAAVPSGPTAMSNGNPAPAEPGTTAAGDHAAIAGAGASSAASAAQQDASDARMARH